MKKIAVFLSVMVLGFVSLTGVAKEKVLQSEGDVSKTISGFAPHEGFEALYIYAKKNDGDKNFLITVTTVNGGSKSKEDFIVPYGIFYPLYQKLLSAGILKQAFLVNPGK